MKITYETLEKTLNPNQLRNILGGSDPIGGGENRECHVDCKDGSEPTQTISSCPEDVWPCGYGVTWSCYCL